MTPRRTITCPCGAEGKLVWVTDRVVVFWKRPDSGVWWRDETPDSGPRCGYCTTPASVLLWNGWAERKRT